MCSDVCTSTYAVTDAKTNDIMMIDSVYKNGEESKEVEVKFVGKDLQMRKAKGLIVQRPEVGDVVVGMCEALSPSAIDTVQYMVQGKNLW